MMDLRQLETGELIRYAMSRFRAERRERFIHAGGRLVRTHTAGERVLFLPNGSHVKVSVDDSDTATQVEEDEALHAIVRPAPIRMNLRALAAAASNSHAARPRALRTSIIPRRNR